MALSLRQKQLNLIVRMLHLNQPTPPPQADVGGEEEVYKILVMDAFCLELLSPLLRVADLRKHGVTLYFPIDKPRQQVPDAPAVYFLRPSPANADRIAADAAAALYASFHLNFSTSLPRPILDRLAAATAASKSAHRIARIADQYIDFVSLEDNLFSLAQPRSYVALNDPAAADADIEALVDALALGLFCVAATLGTVPVIRCARGGPAEMVAAALDARLRDHLLAKPNLFTEATSASFQRPVLCLFDRNFELSVGIQHDWSYRPLVHDVLALKLNKLKMPADKSGPAKTYDLDDSDTFWLANSWSPFPKVAEEIEAQLARYKQDVDDVNQRTGGKDGVDFDGTDLIGNTKHLMNAVSSLPELTDRKKMIDKHTNIATVLLGHIKERSLDGYCDCENDMLVKGTVDRNTLLSLLRGKGTKEDKLRLAVIYLLSLEAPPPSELEQVETAPESEVDMSAFQYVKRIKSLNTQFSASSSTASRSNIVDWAEKLYGQSISAVTAGVKNLLSAGRQLALTRTVEALMEGKPNPEVDSYLLLDPRAPRSGTGGQFKGPFREAVVFMIGGGNYIEYRSLMELVERSQPSKQVIYGATEILNGAEFIQQLAELGRKTGLGGGSSNPQPQ